MPDMPQRLARRSAFTLLDLTALLVVAGLVFAFVVLAAARTREPAWRVQCASNLRQIGQALLLYANANGGKFPRATYIPGAATTCYTGWKAPDPFGPGGPDPNDVTAALFLLLRTQNFTPDAFVCPMSGDSTAIAWDYAGGTAATRSNFPSRLYLSYSFADPYPSDQVAKAGYDLNAQLSAEFAVAADMNPGTAELLTITTASPHVVMRKGNSPNHGGEGQNILYGDSHVSYELHPFAGVRRDNIYTYGPVDDTAGGVGIVGMPTSPDDSILLPTALQGPTPPVPGFNAFQRWIGPTTAIILTLAIALIAWGISAVRSRTAMAPGSQRN